MRFDWQTRWVRILIEILEPVHEITRYRVVSRRDDGRLARDLTRRIHHQMKIKS